MIGNNGPIDVAKGAVKADAVHPAGCCQQGHADRLSAEHDRLHGRHRERARPASIKHGSKMIQAVDQRDSAADHHPVIGGSFGAGNYGMCGRAFASAFHLQPGPTARTAVMGGEQAAEDVMKIGDRGRSSSATAKAFPPTRARSTRCSEGIVDQFERESTAEIYGTAHLWDDGIIDPRDTRLCPGLHSRRSTRANRSCGRSIPCTFGVDEDVRK